MTTSTMIDGDDRAVAPGSARRDAPGVGAGGDLPHDPAGGPGSDGGHPGGGDHLRRVRRRHAHGQRHLPPAQPVLARSPSSAPPRPCDDPRGHRRYVHRGDRPRDVGDDASRYCSSSSGSSPSTGIVLRMVWFDGPAVLGADRLPRYRVVPGRSSGRLRRRRSTASELALLAAGGLALHGRGGDLRPRSAEPVAVDVRVPRDLAHLRRCRRLLSLGERVLAGRLTVGQLARTDRRAPGWRPARTSRAADVASSLGR